MSPSEQFAFVDEYNWDDGLEPINSILLSDSCALETALLAFWRADGPFLFVGEIKEEKTYGPFTRWLADQIRNGRYARKLDGFDPMNSEGISKTQIYKLRKAGLPEVFFGNVASV